MARVVMKPTKRTSNKPLLNRLQWLPITSRTDLKTALKQPPSLRKHLKLRSMHFITWNNDKLLLWHSPVGTNCYGCRAFSYTAPTVWNKIAHSIRIAPIMMSFRKKNKHTILKVFFRRPDGWDMSSPEVC